MRTGLKAGVLSHGVPDTINRVPRNITKSNGDVEGNPHPDATGGNKAKGADILLTLQYTRTGLSGPTYKVWRRPYRMAVLPQHPACETGRAAAGWVDIWGPWLAASSRLT